MYLFWHRPDGRCFFLQFSDFLVFAVEYFTTLLYNRFNIVLKSINTIIYIRKPLIMRKLQNIVLIAMLLIFFSAIGAYAEKNTYNVGIINDFNYSEHDLSSYGRASVNKLFPASDNVGLEFYDFSTATGIERLKNGSLSFLAMLPKSERLSENVDFTDRPIAVGFLSLFVKSDKDLYFKDYLSFKNIRIATLENDYFENMLSDFAAQYGFTYTIVHCSGADGMMRAIEAGEADAMLSPATVSPANMRVIAKVGRFEYYCGVRKGDTAMLSILNRCLTTVAEDYPFYLSEGYLGAFHLPYNNMIAMTESDYRAAADKKKLRVYVPDNYPTAFYNRNKQSYDGLFINMVEEIASNAGLELEYIPNDFKSEDALIENIVMGRADALLTVSASTQGVIEATEPYASLTFYPVSEGDVNAADPLTVGITEDNVWITTYIKEKYPNWTVQTFNSINSLFTNTENGTVNAALVSVPELQTKTSLIAHPSLSISQSFSLEIPVQLGISKITCTSQLVKMLNGIIHTTPMEGAELENKIFTLSSTYVPNFRDMMYANRLWVLIILIVILIIILLFYLRARHFHKLSRIDMLTKVYNADYLFSAADKMMSKNPSKSYLLTSVDAMNFKLVNDRFGIIIGDQTLASIANKIKALFKDKGLVGRLEGDNFIIITEDTPDHRRLLSELEKLDIHIHDSTNYQVHLKIGVCPIKHYDSKVPISIYADRANIAKEGVGIIGHNYLRYFTERMYSLLEIESELEVDMITALRRGEFIAYYQPKYDIKTNRIIGAEALVRWDHRIKGLIPPGIFVPLFERNGFINEVDFCVYEQVLRMIKKRLMNNRYVSPISMNVSRCHLADNNFMDKLEELVLSYEIPKKYIDMEITESIFSEGDTSAKELVYELKKRGFTVSMDDFGSGYSSLNLLRVMPIDTLKIDKAFIDDIETSSRSLCIVEEIIKMANRINIKTICEGIENEAQRDILRHAGCDMAQGYYYSKPITEEAFEALLDDKNNI